MRPSIAALLLAVTASAAQAAPEISTTSLPDATAGSAYSTTLAAANGTSPYTWSVADGSLPGGLSLDGGSGEISGTSNTAATTGFVVLVTDAVGDTASRAFTISVSAAAASTLAFDVEPTNVVAGVAISPAVEVKVTDAFGNAVADESVSLSLVGTGGLTGGSAVVTNAAGIASFPALILDTAGSKQLSASSGALTPATSASFTVSAAAAATLVFDVEPTNVVAGVAISPAVQVHARDAFGNDTPGAMISLSLLGSGVLTGGSAVAADGSGIATFSSLSVDLAGSKQLSAASGSATPATSAAFSVSAAAAAALAFDVEPTNVVAGVAISPAVEVKVTDAFGNAVADESVSLSLVGTGGLTGGGAVVTNAGGIASFPALILDTAGSKQLSASSGALTPATSASFTVSAAAAATLVFDVEPTNVVAGVAISPAVQVHARDAFGNDTPGAMVSLSLLGSGVLTGGSAVAADGSGIATFSSLSVDLAGSKQLSAASGSATPATSAAFSVSAASAAALAFDVEPTNVVAGVAISPAVEVKVTDAFGNAVADESVSLSLIGTGGLTGGGAVVTNAGGIASFPALILDTAGSKQLSASSGALTPATSASFTVSAAAAATLAFDVEPSNVVAGVAISPAVEVKVTDAFGNAVADESVSLSLVGTGGLTGGGAVVTNAGGIASFPALILDTAGSKQLSASSGALTPATSASFTVSAAAAATLVFDVEPTNVVAGVAISPAVQVHARDAFGNDTPGAMISLSLLGSGVLTGGSAVAADGSGIATFSSLSVDLAGSKQLSAASGSATPATSAAFSVSAAAATALAFEVEPSNVVAGVVISPAVQVKVTDAFGNAVADESVSLSLVGTGSLTGGSATLTDVAGIASFASLSIDVQGSKQLSAASGALNSVSSASFTVSCPVIAVDPASLPSGSVGGAYSQLVTASGGAAPYTYSLSAGALPDGLTLSPSGLLSGTPTTNGAYDFTVLATDANGCTGERAYSVIVCGTVAVLPATLPDAQQGAPYSQQLTATGGVAPYSYTISLGALPAGLTLSPAGLVSGTPSESGVFNFTVTATSAGGCVGASAITLTVPGVPVAVSDLVAVRQPTGNDGDGTSLMSLTFTPSAFTASVEVYRAPFGGYPRYDDDGGLVPPTPSYPPGSPWVLTGVTASGQTDDPAGRDAWAYVVFLKNSVDQVSSVSNKTASLPNYALGDVSDGVTAGTGDNLVDDLDISLLGAHYGITGGSLTSAGVHYLDVGPTTDFLVTSRPFTDTRLDFEDLIVFATNYGSVSAPATIVAGADAAERSAKGLERVRLNAPSLVEAGQVFEVALDVDGSGRMQGLSAELAWDPSVAELVSFASAGWVEAENGVVWSPGPGVVDAALLGARSIGFKGTGTVARWTLRARRLGDPGVRLERVLARDAANRPLGDGALAFGTRAAVPLRTVLLSPWPNPASGPSTIAFALSQAGNVELAIYSVDGRRVRTLASGPFEPGSYRFVWDGDDDQRRGVAPGVYYAQLITQGRRLSRSIVHLR